MNNSEKLVGMRLYLVMLGMLLTGTANTILTKWQNGMVGLTSPPAWDAPKEDPLRPSKFTHPYYQSANMFLGEMLCLVLYGAKMLYQRRQRDLGMPTPMSPGAQAAGTVQLKTDINPLLLAIPAAFDMIGSTLMNVALTMIPASVYQMLRGMIIIVTAVMSILFLKRKLFRHHWSSVGVIFLGVALVGLAAVLESQKEGNSSEIKPLGLVLLVIAQLFSGGLLIVEEKLLGDYYLDPLKVVGLEGVWGFLMTVILLPIFQQINCGPNDLCYYGKLEDTMRAF
jgi:drug/metabolite transporter (DMT)-like permease